MEVLFKRNQYDEAMEFYKEDTSNEEWKQLLLRLIIDKSFKEYFIQYIIEIDEILSLQMFLSKIFQNATNASDSIIKEILSSLIESKSIFAKNEHINSLMIYQLLKLCLKDITYREQLKKMISSKTIQFIWLEDLLLVMEFYDELGLYNEINQHYSKAYEYYFKSRNMQKMQELKEVLEMINSEILTSNKSNNKI